MTALHFQVDGHEDSEGMIELFRARWLRLPDTDLRKAVRVQGQFTNHAEVRRALLSVDKHSE